MDMKTRVLVCGAGSIGRRHIKNLKAIGADVFVWRRRTELAKELEKEFGVTVFASLEHGLKQVDAVVVATATDSHISVATDAAKCGKAIFIEKPVSHNLDGVKEFCKLVEENNIVVEVGCQLRAHPNLIMLFELIMQEQFGPLFTFRAVVGQRLDCWRPGTDYRCCYSSDASRGGGALFDLIHEIDLIHWLAGPVKSIHAHLTQVSDLDIKGEDLANLIMVTENDVVGQVQLDMLSPTYRRGLEFIFRDAVLTWDYRSGTLECITDTKKKIVNQVPQNFERNTLFLKHMQHFIERTKNSDIEPLCSLSDGIAALRTAHAARLSNKIGGQVLLKEVAV